MKKVQKLKILALILTATGMLLSAYLWYQTVDYDPNIPCTSFSNCGAVISGKYGKIFEVPVAALGFFYYGVIALLLFIWFYLEEKLIENLIFAGLMIGMVFTVYLRYLEFVKIGEICIWCWGSVAIIILLITTFVVTQKETSKV